MIPCKECIFFVLFLDRQAKDLGECRYTAPVIIQNTGHRTGMFPIMATSSLGCGAGELKEEKHEDNLPV